MNEKKVASVRLPVTILLHPYVAIGVPQGSSSTSSSGADSCKSPSVSSPVGIMSPTLSAVNSSTGPTSPISPLATGRSSHINPEESESSSSSSSSTYTQEHVSSEDKEIRSIYELRNKFLDFCEKQDHLAGEFEVKLTFLEYFLDPVSEKVLGEKTFKTVEDVLIRLEKFCKQIINTRMASDLVEFEKQRNESKDQYLFYLKTMPAQLSSRVFKHEYLKEFLQNQMTLCLEKKPQTLRGNDTNKEIGIIDEIQWLADMFLIELGDWFAFFEQKHSKHVYKWLNNSVHNQSLPKYVLEIYRRKKELDEKAMSEFRFNTEDLNMKHVIDYDWKFTKWMCKELNNNWYLTYSGMPQFMQWNSDEDFSTDNMELRNSKIVGYLDYTLDDVVKSTHYDTHLEYCFQNVEWHHYTPINQSSSLQKYPAALMTATFDFGPLFALRGIQFVFSSKSQFLGKRMIENAFLFKSSDYVKHQETKDLIKIPFVGTRIYSMIDKNRTRYVESRTCNFGGFLNKKFIYTNPLSAKKFSSDNFNGISKAIKLNKEKGFPAPDFEKNYLAKIWYDYCKHYCDVDLQSQYSNQDVATK